MTKINTGNKFKMAVLTILNSVCS